MRRLSQFRLRTLILVTLVAAGLSWWYISHPRLLALRQMVAGRKRIEQRDRIYLRPLFGKTVRANLVTVIGDSRLTQWSGAKWIECPNRQVMVVHAADHTLIVWDRKSGEIVRGFYDVSAAAMARESERFYMMTDDGRLRSWSLGDDAAVDEPGSPAKEDCWAMSCTADGNRLALLSADGATIWDRVAGRVLMSLPLRFSDVVFPDGGETVLLAHSDTVVQYDIETRKEIWRWVVPPTSSGSRARVYPIRLSSDRSSLFVADASGRLYVFDWEQKKVIGQWRASMSSIYDIQLRTDGGISTAGAAICEHFAWRTAAERAFVVRFQATASAIYTGENGEVYCVRGGRLVEMSGNRLRRMAGGARMDATCFAFSPRGDRIALAGRDGQIIVRETQSWEQIQSWRAHDAWIRRLVWLPRSELLASLADDNVLAIWNAKTGVEQSSQYSPSAFSRRMVTTDARGKLAAWNGGRPNEISTGLVVNGSLKKKKRRLCGPAGALRGDIVLSRDGKLLLWGGARRMVNIWDLRKAAPKPAVGPVSVDEVKLALSHDEKLVFAGDVRRVCAIDVKRAKVVWTVGVHRSTILDVSSHPRRPLVATAGTDGTVALIDARKGVVLHRLRLGPSRGKILQVDFSPDGKLLAAAMSNGAVVVMQVP